jgi:5-methylcytosine-specific restriction protein B
MPVKNFRQFAQVVHDEIIPLLQEYCYEDYAPLERILGPGLIDVRSLRIREDLFIPERAGELVQALLAPMPEIATSPAAIRSDELEHAEEAEEDDDDGEASE